MRDLIIDFESFFGTKYSLKAMGYPEYVRHAKFKVHGCAIKEADGPAVWIDGEDCAAYFAGVDWPNTRVIGHNLNFDGFVLTQAYGVRGVGEWADTLAYSRLALPLDKFELDAVAPALNLGNKVEDALEITRNKRDLKAELTPEEYARFLEYAVQDADLAYGIWKILAPLISEDEKRLAHITTRCSVEPTLVLDVDRARNAHELAKAEQTATIEASGYPKKLLSSNPQYAQLLFALTGQQPRKISTTTGKETDALGNGDIAYLNVIREFPEHKHVWAGRKAAKSTVPIKRPELLVRIAEGCPNHSIPMPLNYCGAHTGRWSGGGRINPQNLQRGSEVRRSFTAPAGYQVVVCDSSQIELRVNAWWCGQTDTLDILRRGKDVYTAAAAKHFGIPYTDVTKEQRQFGKVLELALGYGMGVDKFRTQCAVGPMGMPPMFLSAHESQRAVYGYRESHAMIKATQTWLHDVAIPAMAYGQTVVRQGVTFTKHAAILPSGRVLHYYDMRWDELAEEWVYGHSVRHRIYGGLLLENLIQAMARDIVAEQMLAGDTLPELHVVSMTHDEIIGTARDNVAELVYGWLEHIMSQPPTWAPDLPVEAEGGWAKDYSK